MISKNGIGLIIMVISLLGGNVSEAALTTTITTIGELVSVVLLVVNQIKRSDVDKFIFKK